MARQEYGEKMTVLESLCSTFSAGVGWDYRNEECADFALQGNLPGVYTHTLNARDLDAVMY